MVSSYSSQSFGPPVNSRAAKKLKYKTYSKGTDNIATICMIYEGEKKAVLNFTSLHSIMDYFVSMKILKLYKLESG